MLPADSQSRTRGAFLLAVFQHKVINILQIINDMKNNLRCKRLLMTGFHWHPDYALLAMPVIFGIMLHHFPNKEKEGCRSSGFAESQKIQIVLFQFKKLTVTNVLAAIQGLKRAVKLPHSKISLSLKRFCGPPYHLCIWNAFPYF